MSKAREVDAISVDNVAALANLSPRQGQTVFTRGYYTAGDGGGNEYRYDATSAATVDGGFVITAGTGRFLALDQTVANVRQFGAYGDNTNDDTTTIQAAIDAGVGVYLPAGDYKITDTLLLKRGGCHIWGDGENLTRIYFVNAAGGVGISGDTNKQASTTTYEQCSIKSLTLASTAAATDPSVYLDITSFSYSTFDVAINTKRVNGVCIYGQGNNGSSPYYNVITSSLLFGDGAAFTQTGIEFAPGAWAGGSPGPNANLIGPIKRAAALSYFADIKAGNGNLFSQINGESVGTAYFRLNNNTAVATGTSTGSNSQVRLFDTGQAWTTNAFVGYAVKITGGTGSGQVRRIASNSATTLVLNEAWASLPDATSTYEIYPQYAYANKISQIRGEGLASDNPDFIQAEPGASDNVVDSSIVVSLGSGIYVRDDSGDARNSWYGQQKLVFTESILNPGPSANIDLYPKNSVFGGVKLAGSYVVEWLKVTTTSVSSGDSVTVNLDVGGTGVGNGDMTLTAVVANGDAVSTALPASTEKIPRDGSNRSVFVNLQTGAAFSTTQDVQVTWCVTLI